MSPRVVLLAAVAVTAALLAGPAAAAPEAGLLVVQGQGGTTTELVLQRELVLEDTRPDLIGGRSHAAVLIEPAEQALGGQGTVGAVSVRAFNDGTGSAVAVLGVESRLRPGRYTVSLLGDGVVRAAYRIGDDPGISVAPRRVLRTQFLGRAEQLGSPRSAARVDLPGALPRDRRALQVTLLNAQHVSELRMCATGGQQCEALTPLPLAASAGGPQIVAHLVPAASEVRALRWRVDGTRLTADRLRAAAILF
jgi:hypothetical protein